MAAAVYGSIQGLTWVLTSGGNGEVFRNGSSIGTAGYTYRNISAVGATYLGSSFDGASDKISGDIMEFLIYEAALSASDREQVETYLNNRWSIY